MMISRVARRYAQAVFGGFASDEAAARFFDDVADVRASLEQSRELLNFFLSPVISRQKKGEVIDMLFAQKLGTEMIGFLKFLVEKTREQLLPEILEALILLRRQKQGIHAARIITAVNVTEDAKSALQSALARRTGHVIEANYTTDRSLIGGVVVRLGDTVYDGSVANQLKRLRREFASGVA